MAWRGPERVVDDMRAGEVDLAAGLGGLEEIMTGADMLYYRSIRNSESNCSQSRVLPQDGRMVSATV